MKTIMPLILSSLLLVGAAACQKADNETSSDAPSSVNQSPKAPDAKSADATKNDATDQTRKNQVNADIKAREDRNNAVNGGSAEKRPGGDLSSEVRSKLEANIPASQLDVHGDKDGKMIVTGTVPNASDKTKIDGLVKQIKGVKTVDSSKVAVAAPTKK